MKPPFHSLRLHALQQDIRLESLVEERRRSQKAIKLKYAFGVLLWQGLESTLSDYELDE